MRYLGQTILVHEFVEDLPIPLGWKERDDVYIRAVIMVLLSLIGSVQAQGQATPAAPPPGKPEEAKAKLEPNVPKPEMERPTVWGKPTEVQVGIYVIDVDRVDSANQKFSASVYIEARWHSPLLRHAGPSPMVRRLTEIWTPRLVIVNQQQAWPAFPAAVEISPAGDVVYRQKTWGWFSQPLDLRDFPLDRQKLTIHLVAAGQRESDVKIVPLLRDKGRRSGRAENFSMPDFDVVSWKAESRPYYPFKGQVGVAGFIMEIDIERRILFYVWKVIFPLCLIVIMSWMPRWIDPKQIGPTIAIANTSFLTLVAYLFAITMVLPRVPYFTRMDQFILFSTLMVFISLLQTAVTTTLVQRTIPPSVARIDRWSRVIFPLLLIAVLAISFAI